MTLRCLKRARKQLRLGLERLEHRLVMSAIPVSPSWEFAANDDGFTISKDREQQEYQVLANDQNYRRPAIGWNGVTIDFVTLGFAEPGPLRITSVSSAGHGSVGISEDGGSVLYTPSVGFTGIDRFSYTVANADGDLDEADVFFNVVEPIFAMRDWFRVDEGSAASELDVLKNDSQNVGAFFGSKVGDSPLRIVAVGPTSHGGTLDISHDGQRILYTPAGAFAGLESLTYTIENEQGFQSEATVLVQVTTVDDDNPHQAWKEQVEQRFLEAAVERSETQFGRFASNGYFLRIWDDSPIRAFPFPILAPSVQRWSLDVDVATAFTSQTNVQVDTSLRAWTSGSVTRVVSDNVATDSSYSQTNVQVDGVDEGDVVKTDGDYLYILSDWFDEQSESVEHQLIMVDVRDPASPAVVSRYGFDGDVLEQFLHGDRLTVISQSGSQLLVTVLDVSDRSDPALLYETTIEGTLESTRAIGDFVYVIASTYSSMQLPTPTTVCETENEGCFYETKQQFFTRVADNILDETLFGIETHDASGDVVDTHSLLDLSQLLELTETNSLSFSAVLTFDVTSDELGPAASTMFSHGTTSEVYVSTEAIYVLEQTHSNGAQTSLHKLSIGEEGDVRWVASGSVDGRVLNQFSVDEYDGYLRIATTSSSWSDGSSLYVLQQTGTQLDVVGSVVGLAPGEQIYSARFDGSRAFVVTYRKTDPLFVFDLSDPTSPQVLGQLKISGYSNYLQLIDDNHLLGIGREANASGLFQEIQVSLFDISDFDNPTILHRYSFEGGRNLWSPIMADAWNLGTHHSVSYFAGQQILVLPTYQGNGSSWSWVRNGAAAGVTMQVLSIDVGAGISLLGQVDMGNPFDPHQARSVRIDDVLFSISPEKVKANELFNPANELGELLLGVSDGLIDDANREPRQTISEPEIPPSEQVKSNTEARDVVFRSLGQPLDRSSALARRTRRAVRAQRSNIIVEPFGVEDSATTSSRIDRSLSAGRRARRDARAQRSTVISEPLGISDSGTTDRSLWTGALRARRAQQGERATH